MSIHDLCTQKLFTFSVDQIDLYSNDENTKGLFTSISFSLDHSEIISPFNFKFDQKSENIHSLIELISISLDKSAYEYLRASSKWLPSYVQGNFSPEQKMESTESLSIDVESPGKSYPFLLDVHQADFKIAENDQFLA
jgi:hypothetical protein